MVQIWEKESVETKLFCLTSVYQYLFSIGIFWRPMIQIDFSSASHDLIPFSSFKCFCNIIGVNVNITKLNVKILHKIF